MSVRKANHGLTDHTPDVKDAVVDIVFVHGLQGDAQETWTKYSVFWPKAYLAQDIKNARIMTWGYDSAVKRFFGKTSDNKADGYSSSLLSDLKSKRAEPDTSDRPIIFVAHSLGGLVCANAVVQANNSSDDSIKKIAALTKGFIFLGTPFEGRKLRKWAERGLAILHLIKGREPSDNLKDLEEGSDKLIEINSAFSVFLRERGEAGNKVGVACFFEEYATEIAGKSIGKVVPQESATLIGYGAVSIPEDHRNMVKFKSKDDAGYVRVSSKLIEWVRNLDAGAHAAVPSTVVNVYGGQGFAHVEGSNNNFTSNNNNIGNDALKNYFDSLQATK